MIGCIMKVVHSLALNELTLLKHKRIVFSMNPLFLNGVMKNDLFISGFSVSFLRLYKFLRIKKLANKKLTNHHTKMQE